MAGKVRLLKVKGQKTEVTSIKPILVKNSAQHVRLRRTNLPAQKPARKSWGGGGGDRVAKRTR